MTTAAEQELIAGLKNDMNLFWLEETANARDLPLIYPKYWKSEKIDRKYSVKDSASLNVRLVETNDRVKVERQDPIAGRNIVGKIRRFLAGFAVERSMMTFAKKTALMNMIQDWIRAAKSEWDEAREQYYADLFNKGGFILGDAMFNCATGPQDDPSGPFIYDGKPLFNLTGNARTLLKVPAGVTNSFYNSLGYSGIVLTSDNIDLLYTLLTSTNARNDVGHRRKNFPKYLLANPSKRGDAAQVLDTTTGKPGDSVNGANQNQGIVELLLNPYLDSDFFGLVATNGNLVAFDQVPPIFDIGWDNDHKMFTVDAEFWHGHRIDGWNGIAVANAASA